MNKDLIKNIAIAFFIYMDEMAYEIDLDDSDYYFYVFPNGKVERVSIDKLYDKFFIKFNKK